MPSPVGHILAGAAVYLAAVSRRSGSSFLLLVALLGSIVPDLDFLPGILIGNMRAFHHGMSHSFVFVMLFGFLMFLIAKWMHPQLAVRASLIGAVAYASHVTLDFVNVNEGTRGVPLLWPFVHQELGINLRAFGHFRYTDIRNGIASVIRSDNVAPLVRELSIIGGLVLALFVRRRIVRRPRD